MLAKLEAQYIQAFLAYKSADGTPGVTGTTAGVTFKNGLYVGGTFSASALPITTDNITISGAAGNGYIQYGAQTAAPAIALVHTYADAGGHFAIGQSGSSGKTIVFTNGLMTADRDYAFQNKSGTLAMTTDNLSQFTNDTGFVAGPGSAVSGRLPSFNGTTGKLLQDSGILASSVVLNTLTLTEGAGLAGNTYDLSANRTLAMGTPGTLSITSTNAVSGTTHSHVITSSSNPGAAASLLASDGSGFLTLPRFTATGYMFVNASTANLYLKDTSTGLQVATTGVITPQSGNTVRNTSFTSGVRGWNTSDAGDAEFNNVRVRGELSASVFKISEITATAGTQIVSYSAAAVFADFTTPAAPFPTAGYQVGVQIKNSDAGATLLAAGDVLRIKSWTGSGIADSWFTVDGIVSNSGAYSTYTLAFRSGTASVTFRAGTAVVDYGPSGAGFITLSADGTIGSSPNLTMATHSGTPWSGFTTLLRLGNLNGSYGYVSNVYGFGVGQYGAAEPWLTFDTTNGIRIGNNTTTIGQWDTSGNILVGQTGSSQGNVFISSGGTVSIRRGTTDYITLSTTDAQFTNLIKMSGANAAISLGSTPPTSATAGTGIWIDRSGLYALSAGTQNTIIDATGITTAAGQLKLSSSGLVFVTPSTAVTDTNSVSWRDAGNNKRTGILSNYYTGGVVTAYLETKAEASSDSSVVNLLAVNDLGVGSGMVITRTPRSGTNKGYLNLGSASTWVTIGDLTALPTHTLDVAGASGTATAFAVFDAAATGSGIGIGYVSGTQGYISTQSAIPMVLMTNGTAGVTISPANAVRFHAYGAGTLSTDASGNITASSDEKLKTRIRKFRKGLDTIKRIEPILYRWNKRSGLDRKNDYVGFGARHTKRHLPEAIGKGKNGFHTMSDRVILATVVNAIKELEHKYASLQRT